MRASNRPLIRPGALPVFSLVLFALATSSRTDAQLFDRPTVLQNARIVTMAGAPIEKGTILIKGERIGDIGPTVKAPFLSRTVDLTGKTVTPGFIDAWSALGHLGGSAKTDPTGSSWDAFDRYARDDFREALRHGVTTVFLSPAAGPGIAGTGVLVQLVPESGGAAGKRIEDEGTLCINLGSGQSAITRIKTFDKIRKQFRKALDYRQALEDYEEDLKEYLEKLEERAKEKEKEKKAGEQDAGEETPPEDKPEADEGGEEKPDDNGKNARAFPLGEASFKSDEEKEDSEKEQKDGAEEKKEEEKKLEKPTEPTPDRESEVLLTAIDRKVPVRVGAHRSEDILNALELAEEFNLDLLIEGATDAYLVAGPLAEAEVPVILGPVARTALFENNEYRRHTERNAASLSQAGVSWTMGSGGKDPWAARFVAFSAQLAAGHGAQRNGWIEICTREAADILRVSKRIGRLTRGRQADLVVWSGDPSDPSSVVERVYVAGKLAYQR